MGSSGEDPNRGIDASAGGLVWVRRRNGSWWPGKILSPDELPEGCVPTPRSGTPVKLLGREDASVDWYNLEKSKRVKAFHCGEYEDCIEKAKASASHLSKKGVKYARREDAILHALELENAARLGKGHPGFSATQDVANHHVDVESEDLDEDLNGSEDNDDDVNGGGDDSAHEPSQSGVSYEEQSKQQRRTPNDSEDEGVKRMRGLEDLGMGVIASSSPMKRKRSQTAQVHEFLKRKNRRRTLTKVLECTAMVSAPDDGGQMSSPTDLFVPIASDSKVSGLESNESKNVNSTVINNMSESNGVSGEDGTLLDASRCAGDACVQKDNEISSMVGASENESLRRLYDVPLVAEDKQSADASQKANIGTQSSQSSHIETMSLGNEEQNESGSTSSGTANVHHMWQLKGKRNSRSRKVDPADEAETNVAAGGSHVPDGGPRHLKSRPIKEIQVEESRAWSCNAPQKESSTAPQRLLPYRQSRFTVNPKYDSSDFSLRHHIAGSGLYDVTVEVKTSYRPQHVPYISLMSKLNGQPIIGHPLTVEVLEDGSCDDLISTHECYSSCSELDYNLNQDLSDRRPRGRPPAKRSSFKASSKSPKTRRNGFLSKKIRKLSSLTGSHRLSREEKKPVVEKLKGPSIACVPLKVVFSRINAALTGSVRPGPRLIATNAV